MSSPYPQVPELDWMRDMADRYLDRSDLQDQGERLMNAYKYLLWSRRYHAIDPSDKEGKEICNRFLMKYHHATFRIPLSKFEQDLIEEGFKRHKRRIATHKSKQQAAT